jgi:hypothetical protein
MPTLIFLVALLSFSDGFPPVPTPTPNCAEVLAHFLRAKASIKSVAAVEGGVIYNLEGKKNEYAIVGCEIVDEEIQD